MQPLLSSQASQSGATEFAGQAALEPVQLAAISQAPDEVPQMTELALNCSAGQLYEEPSQVPAKSHGPVASRQGLPLAEG